DLTTAKLAGRFSLGLGQTTQLSLFLCRGTDKEVLFRFSHPVFGPIRHHLLHRFGSVLCDMHEASLSEGLKSVLCLTPCDCPKCCLTGPGIRPEVLREPDRAYNPLSCLQSLRPLGHFSIPDEAKLPASLHDLPGNLLHLLDTHSFRPVNEHHRLP